MLSEVRIWCCGKAREENVTGVTRKVWGGCLYASTCPQKCAWTVRAAGGGRGEGDCGGRRKRKGHERVGRGLVAERQARGANRTRVHRSYRLFSKVARPSTLPPCYIVSTTSATLRDIPKYVSRPTNPELGALKEKKRAKYTSAARGVVF